MLVWVIAENITSCTANYDTCRSKLELTFHVAVESVTVSAARGDL